MLIRAEDSTLYEITWQAATRLAQTAAFTPATFKPGDHLIVVGAPSRNPQSREVTLIQEVRRPSDNWRWENPSRSGRPS